ncbi:alpha/beta hydrolase [Lutimaribacter sp. EGI FJ00015]|uniref:Alpha/beta hydrolase n=1 Tax=Lutimaribacter degradans TaxID=2945989 RepID=A0ACC5ZUS9_9RHOB|nr:alpha/beta hydrolase [Lutimaribacter sp. EGI FJ00013]MCO0613256.1 alpha/beta hydrolase [Lutimaribacter sp. EGI FJ00015]MCO0636233.1 alpha/beta hydrolase [Lutimaribacter sp. EGI FJ00014]
MGAALTVAALAGCSVVIDRRADLREAEAEARYPPTGQLIEVDGRIVHADVQGSGPDLVLLHGASGNTRDFTFSFVDRLKDDYRVIAFDRPGLGWTERDARYGPWSPRAESPREQARLLQAASDRLGVQSPLVLGHSYGGAVALAWGLERPEETAGLIVVSGASNPWPGGLGPLYRVMGSSWGGALLAPLITALGPEGQVDDALAGIFAPDPVPPGYARHIGAGLTLRRESFRANARQVNTLRPHVVEMSQHYPTLTMPVEIVHGTEDDTVPIDIHSEPLARQIPGANLTRLQSVGHMPHHAAPDAVEAAIHRAATRAGLRR